MSFFERSSPFKEFPATILLPGFQASGVLEVRGVLWVYINEERQQTLTLKQATVLGLEVGNPATSMALDELCVQTDRCQVLAFETAYSKEDTGLLPRIERLVAYTSHFAVQGDFHTGADTLLHDFIAASKSRFVACTSAFIFPLYEAQAAVIQRAPMAFVHRDAVWMYHAV